MQGMTQGESACSAARVFSSSSPVSYGSIVPFSHLKASWRPEERPGLVGGLQSHTCGLPLPRMGHKQPT